MDKEKRAFLKKLGAKVAKVRAQRGYSQERVWLEGDIPRVTIYRIECGLVDARASTLKRIADTIGVPLRKLTDID
jgi:transcriptional regulator with XRE-family HTH domain